MKSGFSLVELIFALLVLQVGMLATAGLVLLAQRSMLRAELTVRSVLETGWLADSLASSGGGGSGTRVYPWGQVSWPLAPDGLGGIRVVAVSVLGGDTLATARAWQSHPQRADSSGGSIPGGESNP